MAITNFIPELWSAAIQEPFDAALVYAQPNVVNRDYEGVITQMGDTVNVTSVSRPTIRTYDKTVDITIEDLADTGEKLVIDQGDYFAFWVNDVDRVQAAGNFEASGAGQAGYGLRDKVDTYLAGLFQSNALADNKLGRVTVVDDDPKNRTAGQLSAFQVLVKLREKLDRQSVPTNGRYVIVPPEFVSALVLDPRYTDLSASGSTDALLNGQVGRGSGFDVMVSNNAPKVGGGGADKGDWVISAGVTSALTFANQIVEVESLRGQKRFADMVRGLNVYGAKVFRPEGIATATVTVAPPAAAPAG